MTVLRHGTAILVTIAALLGAANVLVFVQARRDAGPPTQRPATAWERWLASSPAERLAAVRHYQEIAQREDADIVLRRAHQFARLAPERKQRLRDVLGILQETLDAQPPAQRGDWLRSSEQVRAFLAYRVLLTEQPQRLAELRAEWSRDLPPD